MNSSRLDRAFTELTHPGAGRAPDLNAIDRFLRSEQVGRAALLLAYRAALQVTRRVADRDDLAQDAAFHAIETIRRQVGEGEHLQPSRPLASLEAYMQPIMVRHISGMRRVKVPAHVRARGSHAIWLFQKVIVANQPLSESLDELVAAYPGEEDKIRRDAADVIHEFVRHPHGIPKRTLTEHYTKGVADVEEAAPARARSVTGRQMVSPEDAALAVLTREAIERAIARLPNPERTYAHAWYVERAVGSVAELEERFGIQNGKYMARKMKELLAVQLHHLKPPT